MEADEVHGVLDGHSFYLVGDEFSVALGSQGWEILLDQAPSAKPELLRLGGRVKSVAALEPAFIERATQLLMIRAQRMHSQVASDGHAAQLCRTNRAGFVIRLIGDCRTGVLPALRRRA